MAFFCIVVSLYVLEFVLFLLIAVFPLLLYSELISSCFDVIKKDCLFTFTFATLFNSVENTLFIPVCGYLSWQTDEQQISNKNQSTDHK